MIVIPMAGLSSRFFKAGYDKPKYMLTANGKSLFDYAVESFFYYFKLEHFIFIVRDAYDTPSFVKERAKSLGIKSYTIVVLHEETRGQAETVALGLEEWKNSVENISVETTLTIFNIDTFRPGYRHPEFINCSSGYLEVFIGSGSNWSFVKPYSNTSTLVKETAEKEPISNLCCTGLYYFPSISSYLDAYYKYLEMPKEKWAKGELYIAPLYNTLISTGVEVQYNIISSDEVIFCGVPDEYERFLRASI